jgi:hypothetical protein
LNAIDSHGSFWLLHDALDLQSTLSRMHPLVDPSFFFLMKTPREKAKLHFISVAS